MCYSNILQFIPIITEEVIMNWYLAVVKKYAVFAGRARRKEYWMFVLFNILIIFAIAILAAIFTGIGGKFGSALASTIYGLTSIYSLALIIPTLAVVVRRLHDVGKSGWWYFIILVPLIGGIWLLVLMCTDSQPGTNQYGPNPKETAINPPPVQ
jgi:uncharacterized membrane protein YhaH (DUF805 family)